MTAASKPFHHRSPQGRGGALAVMREWADALIIAFVLAMFIRMFIVELFKIPTGSMTPTLIGGQIARVDLNRDDRTDLVLLTGARQPPLYFQNDGERLVARGPRPIPLNQLRPYIEPQYDRILVNKLAYWFSEPSRGDITVFKVPPSIWQKDKPIYIKRCVGEPGESLGFSDKGALLKDGQRITEPEFFGHQDYLLNIDPSMRAEYHPEGIEYTELASGELRIRRIDVPEDQIFVFGDNTHSSLDSRYWGGVALNNVRGRAFLRYMPLDQIKFLKAR